MIQKILEKAFSTHSLSKEEIVTLLNVTNEDSHKAILNCANKIRHDFVGDDVHLRGLIEFSNICKRNCLYCGLRRDNENIERYRLTENQIISFAQNAKNLGYKTVVLQSGEDSYYDVEKIIHIVSEIKKLDMAITLSIGEKSFEEYKAYKDAGADRYLIRIETTDKKLYEELDPQMDWNNRYQCLKDLKTLGYEVGSGSLVGLPNQTIESIADDILFFKEIDADMIGIGPFIPNSGTPLKDAKTGSFELALRVMAIIRMILPDINIPATTAMETLNPNGRIIALQSGANVVMPNVTQGEYRKMYEIYPGKICVNESPDKCINCISAKIKSIGRNIAQTKGFHQKFY